MYHLYIYVKNYIVLLVVCMNYLIKVFLFKFMVDVICSKVDTVVQTLFYFFSKVLVQ